MDHIKLLIVDDVEDNRLVLNAISRKVEGFEIKEAGDGIEALEIVDAWRPHIVMMDVMMPRMDGLEASRLIKARYPETIIMVVTAVIDPQMEEHMAAIGIAAYIHKPIDKELIRFKLQNFVSFLNSKKGKFKPLSEKKALNPFSSDIRHCKTLFDVADSEAMMDFGMWVLSRCENGYPSSCTKVDVALEFFYELMRFGTRDGKTLSIIVEESFEEIFVTMKFGVPIVLQPKASALLVDMGEDCICRGNIACVRLRIYNPAASRKKEPLPLSAPIPSEKKAFEPAATLPEPAAAPVSPPPQAAVSVEAPAPAKEVRVIDSEEKVLLRQSFVNKTSAVDYVREIGGDVLDEIRDLESLDVEWGEKLRMIEDDGDAQSIRVFADNVLGVYVRAINNLFEFTALAYALSSLGAFLKENADAIIADPKKLKTLTMLLEHLGSDLSSWREHIFSLQDTADIHYLDSSFFSSCMQIEGIIAEKEVAADDDNDIEFF
ncbi:MAG: response regulator [Sulfuricurvum sp.]|nr:response regulator [Sulfuricurvum sp.]